MGEIPRSNSSDKSGFNSSFYTKGAMSLSEIKSNWNIANKQSSGSGAGSSFKASKKSARPESRAKSPITLDRTQNGSFGKEPKTVTNLDKPQKRIALPLYLGDVITKNGNPTETSKLVSEPQNTTATETTRGTERTADTPVILPVEQIPLTLSQKDELLRDHRTSLTQKEVIDRFKEDVPIPPAEEFLREPIKSPLVNRSIAPRESGGAPDDTLENEPLNTDPVGEPRRFPRMAGVGRLFRRFGEVLGLITRSAVQADSANGSDSPTSRRESYP